MAINTQTSPKLLWPGQKAIWGDLFYKDPQECYSKCFDVDTSDKAFEEYTGYTGFGLAPVKAQGAALTMDTTQQGYVQRYVNVAYALGFEVTKEELADNLYMNVVSRRIPQLAKSMRQTVETVSAAHFNTASTDSAATNGADGVGLLSAAHPNINGGTWSNELSAAADLSETALEDIIIQINTAKDDRGLEMYISPQRLLIHPNDSFKAHRILASTLQSGTANNDTNALRAMNSIPGGVVENRFFTDTDAWFVKTDCPYGMTFLWRQQAEVDQDNDFGTKNLLVSSYMRFSSKWSDARGVFGSMGS